MNVKLAKTIISVLMASALVMSGSQMALAKVGQESISVHYNGIAVANIYNMTIITQKEPFIYENMVYVPIRAVAEELGYKVTWDNGTSNVSFEEVDTALLEERKITKDSFYGLEYEILEGCKEIETYYFYFRVMMLEDDAIIMSFERDSYDNSLDDFVDELISGHFSNNPVEESLFDLSFMEELALDDSLYEEYDSLWELYRCVEKEIKTKSGTVFIYLESYGENTKDEQLKKLGEFMDDIILKTGQEYIQVAYKDIKVISKGKEVLVEREPFIYNGTMYMAVRDLAKALNKKAEWNQSWSVVNIKPEFDVRDLIFTRTEGCEFGLDIYGNMICDLEKGTAYFAYHDGESFKKYKDEEYIIVLEVEKQKEFDGRNDKLIDYRYEEINGRGYLILDYEGLGYRGNTLMKIRKDIIMETNNGIVNTTYMAYMDDNDKDLELFEKLMLSAVAE